MEDGPKHKPGPTARAMVMVAARNGLSYYTAMNGDDWSPDVPGLTKREIASRMRAFEVDCARRGIGNWRKLAQELGFEGLE